MRVTQGMEQAQFLTTINQLESSIATNQNDICSVRPVAGDELNLVGADPFESAQHRQQLVLSAGPAGHRRHRVDVFGRYPVHIAPQMTMDLGAGPLG